MSSQVWLAGCSPPGGGSVAGGGSFADGALRELEPPPQAVSNTASNTTVIGAFISFSRDYSGEIELVLTAELAEPPRTMLLLPSALLPLPLATTLLDRKSTRLNSSHVAISYAVFCLKKKNKQNNDR